MKTLDEVIKGFECCKEVGCGECPYKILFDDDSYVPCDQFEKDDDALQWLKGYRGHIELDKLRDKYGVTSQNFADTSQIICPKCHSEFVILPEANNPLSWDELKQMAGKPVWLEVDGNWYGKFWAFVEVENDAYVNFYQKGQDYPEDLWKRDIGKTWQAFKKERG